MSPLILVSESTTQTALHIIFTSGGIFLFWDHFAGIVSKPGAKMEEWVRNEVGMAKEIRTEVYKERPLLFKGEGWNSDPSSLLLGRDSMAKATPRRKHLIEGWLTVSES